MLVFSIWSRDIYAGASGYVGSVVLEQLLRFAPDVARIYMLIRGKRGVTGVLPSSD